MKKMLAIAAVGLMAMAWSVRADDPAQQASTVLSPFGIGADAHTNRTLKAYEKWVPQMAAIGITVHRTVETSWGTIEPQEGVWTWEQMDLQMSYLEAHHIQFGGILAGNPDWNKLDPPGNLPVNNIAAWSKYVTETVKHANGRIKYWEVWNEPPNGTGRTQTPADYAKLVMATYDAAKAVDPTCLVGLAAKSVHINYLDQVILAGAKDHFDYVIFHPYEVVGCVMAHPGTEAIYMNIKPTLRKMLAARDPAKVDAPIWITEVGVEAKNKAWEQKQGEALVKVFTMGIAQGIACISWFEGMDGDSGPMGLLRGDLTPRPSYSAMAQMIQHFGEHPTALGWVLLNDKDNAFVFQGAKGTVLVTWAAKGTTDNLDFGQPVGITEPLTGKMTQASTYVLTETPIIVDGLPENLLAQARANKNKPFPWDGDYTNAKSVSIVMGEKNVEKGLHTQSAASIAADVVTYGGAARAGDIPGGNVFMVDPNFLTYTSTPIEISVVVRRDAANDPAKLTLEYESTDGYKKAAVYEVPDNGDWNTATWKIDDAQFVSTWAFNFRLNSGKYSVKSVTVTKRDN